MLPKLEEDVLIHKAERVVEFVDHAGEDTLLLGLGLRLVAGARRRIGHRDLGRLLIGHAQAGGQGPRGLREGKLLLLLCDHYGSTGTNYVFTHDAYYSPS